MFDNAGLRLCDRTLRGSEKLCVVQSDVCDDGGTGWRNHICRVELPSASDFNDSPLHVFATEVLKRDRELDFKK